MLIGSGLGGYLSNKKPFNKVLKGVYLAPLLIVIVNIIFLSAIPLLFKYTSSWSLIIKILLSSLLVMIQGFFMGMPFPRGLTILSKSDKNTVIPIMWGINGVMSVVGSVLSVIISMQLGFTGALITGAVFHTIVIFFNNI